MTKRSLLRAMNISSLLLWRQNKVFLRESIPWWRRLWRFLFPFIN